MSIYNTMHGERFGLKFVKALTPSGDTVGIVDYSLETKEGNKAVLIDSIVTAEEHENSWDAIAKHLMELHNGAQIKVPLTAERRMFCIPRGAATPAEIRRYKKYGFVMHEDGQHLILPNAAALPAKAKAKVKDNIASRVARQTGKPTKPQVKEEKPAPAPGKTVVGNTKYFRKH